MVEYQNIYIYIVNPLTAGADYISFYIFNSTLNTNLEIVKGNTN